MRAISAAEPWRTCATCTATRVRRLVVARRPERTSVADGTYADVDGMYNHGWRAAGRRGGGDGREPRTGVARQAQLREMRRTHVRGTWLAQPHANTTSQR